MTGSPEPAGRACEDAWVWGQEGLRARQRRRWDSGPGALRPSGCGVQPAPETVRVPRSRAGAATRASAVFSRGLVT